MKNEKINNMLANWIELTIKEQTQPHDGEWFDIPGIGRFKNLKFISEQTDAVDRSIPMTFKYDQWEKSEIGVFIRQLYDIMKINFGYELVRLIDDGPYRNCPMMKVYLDKTHDQNVGISIKEGDDNVWVDGGGGSKHYAVDKKIDEVVMCIYSVFKDLRENSDKEIGYIPCERTVAKLVEELGVTEAEIVNMCAEHGMTIQSQTQQLDQATMDFIKDIFTEGIIIHSWEGYLDGGTYEIKTNQGTYCIDCRLQTETDGEIYVGYPKDDNSNLLKDSARIKQELWKAIEEGEDIKLIECVKEYLSKTKK